MMEKAQIVFIVLFLVGYFSVKANRQCFFAMMLIASPFVLAMALNEWLFRFLS